MVIEMLYGLYNELQLGCEVVVSNDLKQYLKQYLSSIWIPVLCDFFKYNFLFESLAMYVYV